MLIGAFFGMVGSFYTAEFVMFAPWFGLLMAGLSGLIAAALFALCAIRLRGDQVIIGTAMTLLALGLTEVIYQRLFGVTGIAKGVPAFQQMDIPLLSHIPFLGRALFSHNILVFNYLSADAVCLFLSLPYTIGAQDTCMWRTSEGDCHRRGKCAPLENDMSAICGRDGGYGRRVSLPRRCSLFYTGDDSWTRIHRFGNRYFWEMASCKGVRCRVALRTRFRTRCAVPSTGLGYPVPTVVDVALCALFSSIGGFCWTR